MAKFASEQGLQDRLHYVRPGQRLRPRSGRSLRESPSPKPAAQILGKETYTKTDTDFSAILTKVAESKAEVLFLPDYYNIVNLVGAQAKEKGVTAVMMGGDGWDSADLDVTAAEGGFYLQPLLPRVTPAPSCSPGSPPTRRNMTARPPMLWRPSVTTPPTC